MESLEIIVPCFNESKCIRPLWKQVSEVMNPIKDVEWSILYVNDGSTDATFAEIEALAKEMGSKEVKYISFSRNFGKEAAILAGLTYSSADYVVLMDADLQHPPKLLIEMLDKIRGGICDVCGAQRVSRKGESVLRSFFSSAFYHVMKKLTKLEMVPGGSDFRMMKRSVVEAIVSMRETGRFTKGIFSWIGFKTVWIPYQNVERLAGTSKWSFSGLTGYAVNGFFSFATTPLRIAVWLGFIVDVMAFVFGMRYFYRSLHYGAPGNGVGTLTMIVTFFGGTIILILGIIGEYLARIYFEVKRRPLFIVKDTNVSKNEK